MSATTPLLEVAGLTVAFGEGEEQNVVVRDVSFVVAEGELLGIVGGSGSGKTTTMRAIVRRLPRGGTILAGDVRSHGRSLLALSERELRGVRGAKIAIIVQNPIAALNPLRRVKDQIGEIVRQHGHKLDNDQLAALLVDVGIVDPERVLRAYPHELSGGMAQRVLIATALALEPELILADEPTSALDVTIQAQIMELVRDLAKRRNLAVIFVTHDIALVSEYCDRVVVMNRGDVVEVGTVSQIIHESKHPYTRELVEAAMPADRLSRKRVTV